MSWWRASRLDSIAMGVMEVLRRMEEMSAGIDKIRAAVGNLTTAVDDAIARIKELADQLAGAEDQTEIDSLVSQINDEANQLEAVSAKTAQIAGTAPADGTPVPDTGPATSDAGAVG